MAATMVGNVDLGFLEKSHEFCLLSHLFPSKVGHKPAWLSLKPLPQYENLSCGVCGKPSLFLLQIYAPVSENIHNDSCFHRTVFIFICKDPKCCLKNNNKNFKVYRSQLSLVNDFYSSEPPNEDLVADDANDDFPNASKYQNLCVICGCHGSKACAKCHKVHYCGKDHQTVHWKSGHKSKCGNDNPGPGVDSEYPTSYLFPEFELVMEQESKTDEKKQRKTDAEKMKDYDKFMQSDVGESAMSCKEVDADLMKMALSDEQEDKAFKKFKKRIQQEPDQAVRYNRGGEPLFVSDENIPKPGDIPNCDCGAERTFEFQILPQLLNYLDVTSVGDSIDWGTLLIYTCSANCDIGNNYHEEFLWKQDFSADSLDT